MQYFVTGATGFIGKRLVKKLLERKGAVVHFLIRKESADKVVDLRSDWGVGATRAVPVFGDLTAKKLGVASRGVVSTCCKCRASTSLLRQHAGSVCRTLPSGVLCPKFSQQQCLDFRHLPDF